MSIRESAKKVQESNPIKSLNHGDPHTVLACIGCGSKYKTQRQRLASATCPKCSSTLEVLSHQRHTKPRKNRASWKRKADLPSRYELLHRPVMKEKLHWWHLASACVFFGGIVVGLAYVAM